MGMPLAALVDTPHLRLDVRAGRGGLRRSAVWAQTSDLDDPWSWLAGGELLMRNGRTLPESPASQAALVRGLAANGMCGLVIGLDSETPELSPAALEAADDLELPVMTVPYSVGFAAIGRAVAEAASGAGSVAATERVYDVIRQSVSRPASPNVFAQLGRDLGCQLAVIDAATGDGVLDGCDPPPPELKATVVEEIARRHGSVPGVLHVSTGIRKALVVEIPDEEPTVLLTYDFRSAPDDLVALQHLASAMAVLLAQQNVRREYDRRIGAELMAQLCDNRMAASDAGRQLAERHLIVDECRVVAVSGASEAGERQLHLSLGRRGIAHLLLRRGHLLFVLVPFTESAHQLLKSRLGPDSTFGISEPLSRPDRTPAALREATWAVRAAETAAERSARYADATMLSVLRDTEEAEVVVDRVLGGLIAYDADHSSDMVTTLDAFLRNGRSWIQTARRLGVHRQTVVYRLDRIQELTGRAIADTGTIAEFWLALRARDLLTVPGEGEIGTTGNKETGGRKRSAGD